MDRIELIISQSRRDTDNVEFSDSTGIPDASFLSWANRAQARIQSRILDVSPKFFQVVETIDGVSNQERYSLPSGIFLGTRLEMVEYSQTGNDRDYYELKLFDQRMRRSLDASEPYGYIRESGEIIVQPAPASSNGVFRLTFQKHIPKLDKRRGMVETRTLSVTQLTALALDTAALTDDDITAMTDAGYITVVDKDGEILMEGIAITAVDSSSGAVTLDGSHTFDDGETCPVDAYVVAGKRHTNVSQLPDTCEDFIAAFLDWKALKKDSDNDGSEAMAELNDIEQRIVEAYSNASPDLAGIPIIDDQYLIPE